MENNAHPPHRTPALLILLLLLGSFVAMAGCVELDDEDDGRVRIIVSILPQKEFAERVGGEHVTVTVMVGEGQDPHGYEPRPSQLKDVAKADLYFTVGSGVEFEEVWMDTLIDLNDDMEVIDGSVGVDLIDLGEEGHDEGDGNETRDNDDHSEEGEGNETHDDEDDHDHEGSDPHIWNSPTNAILMVENLLDALIDINPDHQSDFVNNTKEYVAEIEAIDQEMKTGLANHTGEKFLVYHPSFGYLAHEYNLTQIAIEEEGKEPTPSGIQAIIDQAKEENITTVFVSPQFDESNAQTIADEIGGTVVRIDPLGERYLENMGEIRTKLIQGFGEGGER